MNKFCFVPIWWFCFLRMCIRVDAHFCSRVRLRKHLWLCEGKGRLKISNRSKENFLVVHATLQPLNLNSTWRAEWLQGFKPLQLARATRDFFFFFRVTVTWILDARSSQLGVLEIDLCFQRSLKLHGLFCLGVIKEWPEWGIWIWMLYLNLRGIVSLCYPLGFLIDDFGVC